MNKHFFMRNLLLLVASCALGFAACTEDDTESPVTLYYEQVGDIGPGMPYRGSAPTFRGVTPSEFAIESITLDGAPFTDEKPCFKVNPTDGFLEIRDSEELSLGTYRFTISCLAGSSRLVFTDILTVRMVAATPERIVVTPALVEVDYDAERISWGSARVEAADEAVSFNAYALVQEPGKNYFTISSDGVISVNLKYEGEIPPGIYKPVLRLTTKAGSADYEDYLTVKVNSRPLGITYERNPGTAEVAAAFASDVPVLKGSTDEVHYAILSVVPSTDQFSIDPATGVISLPEGHTLEADTSYEISLSVSNKYSNGEAVALRGVYSVDIVPFIVPIDPATFSYPASTMTEFCLFEVEKNAGFVGDVVTFTLGELPEALQGRVEIDKQTGKIAIARGNDVPIGQYTIPVIASNPKSDPANPIVANLALSVEANPNMFHKFGYGNNLGLPAEEHFDQFRWDGTGSGNDDKVIPLAEGYNDFGDRTPSFKFEVINDWALRNATNTTQNFVDENGDLHLRMRGDRWGQVGYVRVTATLGEGETAVSRSTIVFVMLRNPAKSGQIEFTPFVHRINSRNGGFSDILPTFGADVDPSQVMMSWRQNCFLYEGVATGETPYGGKLEAAGPTRTIYRIWGTYENNGIANPSSRLPFCWYDANGVKDVTNMAKKLGYFDPDNGNRIYVTPNKWLIDGAPVNGILTFQASYSVTANPDDIGKTNNLIPIAIWLDENF